MLEFIPAFSLPNTNRRVILARRPSGIPLAADFHLDETPLGPINDGQFRVRNIYLSVDPAQRGWVNEGANYADPVPVGGVMRALAVGVVVESRCAAVPAGLHVYGWFGWQDYAVVGPEAIFTRIDTVAAPLSAYAGVLGMNGLTAWLALTRIGRPLAGDTVLVSTAAGAVGSLVGQFARAKGCRVVGLTGDDAKVALCTERFGYHAAANYKSADLTATVAALAPDGINLFFDNVGGPILDCVIRQMAVGGRIVQCGTASISNWTPPPNGPRNEREVLTRRLQWGGFVIFDHAQEFREALDVIAAQLGGGGLVFEEDIQHGIGNAPGAIARLYAGENSGKSLIFVGD
jgi:NADPH-dependent curcumin reductase